jgi:hypothetical protein
VTGSIRPLLLLDVDGVLQPTGGSVPPGYERLESAESTVVLNQRHGPWLVELCDLFEVVWATTWGPSANTVIGARLGLPDLPHLELGDLPRAGTRKLSAVQQHVGDRTLAWIDDELYEDARAWAERRPAPTLLRRTAASVGLTINDLEALRAFAAEH